MSNKEEYLFTCPFNGRVFADEIDRSAKSKSRLNADLRFIYVPHNGYFKEVKQYKGALCYGVSWKRCDEDGVVASV